MSKKSLPILKLKLDRIHLDLYRSQIEEKFLKSLYVICQKLEKIFSIYNLEEYLLSINFEKNLYNDSIIKVILSSVPRNDQVEEAAVGLAFCLLFNLYPEISEIECYQAEGEGFDYMYRIGDKYNKIEISGTNTINPQTFTNRISDKRTKFKNGEYWDDNFENEDIFIVDFNFNRYTFWNSKEHNNYKWGGR